jgi:uncharacterized protein
MADLEAAINYWRKLQPASFNQPLAAPLQALAQTYALLALAREPGIEESSLPAATQQAWLAWYASTPDTPCIAICSTSQGDAQCKGCGRSFTEVQHWLSFSPAQKRAVWQRILSQGTAWRFNRYAERALSYGMVGRVGLEPTTKGL